MRFLPDIFGSKRQSPPPMATVPSLPKVTAKRMPPMPTVDVSGADHFLACVKRYDYMAPRDASICAFIAWKQERGEAGRRLQSELCEEYQAICDYAGTAPMPGKWFGKAMLVHGASRCQEECGTMAKRRRYYAVYIPRIATDRARKRRQSAPVANGHRMAA